MFSYVGPALRALALTAILSGVMTPVSAHEGHDHDERPQAGSPGALPRGEAVSNAFELVAVARGETLEFYLDRFATNEPVTGATIEAESPNGTVKASEGTDGAYRATAPWLTKGGRTDLIVTVTAGDVIDILPLAIETAPAAAPDRHERCDA